MNDWDLIERHRDQERMSLGSYVGLILLVITLCIVFCLISTQSHASEENAVERIVDAIYQAEGGSSASSPFGILSVSCEGYNECRQICKNTVINNRIRFQKYRKEGGREFKDFIEFLAHRYAPLNVANDPTNLNRHWIKNVRYFLAKGE